MKKIVLTIYHTGVPAYLIRIVMRLVRKMSPEVKMVEVLETEVPETKDIIE
ncbi:MAG: hypothetical protein LBQ74_09825 [Prevotella sp.]|nr:hypothetical protein [Prevotella sp.]